MLLRHARIYRYARCFGHCDDIPPLPLALPPPVSSMSARKRAAALMPGDISPPPRRGWLLFLPLPPPFAIMMMPPAMNTLFSFSVHDGGAHARGALRHRRSHAMIYAPARRARVMLPCCSRQRAALRQALPPPATPDGAICARLTPYTRRQFARAFLPSPLMSQMIATWRYMGYAVAIQSAAPVTPTSYAICRLVMTARYDAGEKRRSATYTRQLYRIFSA